MSRSRVRSRRLAQHDRRLRARLDRRRPMKNGSARHATLTGPADRAGQDRVPARAEATVVARPGRPPQPGAPPQPVGVARRPGPGRAVPGARPVAPRGGAKDGLARVPGTQAQDHRTKRARTRRARTPVPAVGRTAAPREGRARPSPRARPPAGAGHQAGASAPGVAGRQRWRHSGRRATTIPVSANRTGTARHGTGARRARTGRSTPRSTPTRASTAPSTWRVRNAWRQPRPRRGVEAARPSPRPTIGRVLRSRHRLADRAVKRRPRRRPAARLMEGLARAVEPRRDPGRPALEPGHLADPPGRRPCRMKPRPRRGPPARPTSR